MHSSKTWLFTSVCHEMKDDTFLTKSEGRVARDSDKMTMKLSVPSPTVSHTTVVWAEDIFAMVITGNENPLNGEKITLLLV